MIDFHTHSTASDGTLAPEALVDLAAEKGLHGIALTDHDSVAGIPAGLRRGRERGVVVVPGIEVGVGGSGVDRMHLLGYLIDPDNASLLERLNWLQECRRERVRKIIDRLDELGVSISPSRVAEVSQGASVGRPHVALALREKGYVQTLAEAFQRYLGAGAPAFVPKVEFTSAAAIALIRDSGGVAVLAHPATLKMPPQEFQACLDTLVSEGLQGIEAYWGAQNCEESGFYADAARQRGLVATAGSDFHGANKPGIELGAGIENRTDGEEILDALKSRAGQRRSGPRKVT